MDGRRLSLSATATATQRARTRPNARVRRRSHARARRSLDLPTDRHCGSDARRAASRARTIHHPPSTARRRRRRRRRRPARRSPFFLHARVIASSPSVRAAATRERQRERKTAPIRREGDFLMTGCRRACTRVATHVDEEDEDDGASRARVRACEETCEGSGVKARAVRARGGRRRRTSIHQSIDQSIQIVVRIEGATTDRTGRGVPRYHGTAIPPRHKWIIYKTRAGRRCSTRRL